MILPLDLVCSAFLTQAVYGIDVFILYPIIRAETPR